MPFAITPDKVVTDIIESSGKVSTNRDAALKLFALSKQSNVKAFLLQVLEMKVYRDATFKRLPPSQSSNIRVI